jgi:hypothetical protein
MNPFLLTDVSRLGGIEVSVLAPGPEGRVFKPDRGDGFLRAIKFATQLSSYRK